MKSLRRAYADTADGQLHYAEAGSGEHLVLLGETPRSYRFFERLIPLLGPRFHVVAPDLPGLGNSHALPAPASVPGVADSIARFLDALGIERTHVFGMHTGNKVAAALAADHPERIEKLILAGQSHSMIATHSGKRRGGTDLRSLSRQSERYERSASLPASRVVEHQADAGCRMVAREGVDGNTDRRRVDHGRRSGFDLAEAVSRIPGPALILELMPQEEEHLGSQAGALAGLMKHARVTSIPVTHGAAMENQRDEIARIILSFFNEPEAQ